MITLFYFVAIFYLYSHLKIQDSWSKMFLKFQHWHLIWISTCTGNWTNFACLIIRHLLSLQRPVVRNLNYIYIARDPDSSVQRKLTGPLGRVLTLTVILPNSLWLCVIPLPGRFRTSTLMKCSSPPIHLFV